MRCKILNYLKVHDFLKNFFTKILARTWNEKIYVIYWKLWVQFWQIIRYVKRSSNYHCLQAFHAGELRPLLRWIRSKHIKMKQSDKWCSQILTTIIIYWNDQLLIILFDLIAGVGNAPIYTVISCHWLNNTSGRLVQMG